MIHARETEGFSRRCFAAHGTELGKLEFGGGK
jgi:hypothetical protein